MTTDQRTGILLILLSALGYSFLPTITKTIYSISTFEPLDIALWRFIFATPLIWSIVLIRQRRQGQAPTEKIPVRNMMLMGVIFSGAALSAFFGLERVPASTFVVLFYTYPAIVIVLSFLMGERIEWIRWFALVMALIGVALTVPDFASSGGGDPFGILLAFVNALFVAVYFLLSKRVLADIKGVLRAIAYMMTGTLGILLPLILVRGLQIPPNPETWFALILLAAFCTVIPIFATNAGIQKIGPSQASLISTVEPVLSMTVAMILLGEVILFIQWLGAAFIIGSVILSQMRSRTKRKNRMATDVN